MACDPITEAPHVRVTLEGQALWLLPERAMFWAEESMLLVADAHFGKAAAFRARGVPVPEATTDENLACLDALIARWSPRRLAFLGDFAHAKEAANPSTREALLQWRSRHRNLELILVRGNHDIVDSALPLALDMRTIEEPWKIGSLALCHHPQDVETHYALAGHLHPAYRLLGRANERTRVPCFWFGPKRAVLPAFGAFTGCCVIQPGEGDEIYLAGPDRIHALPRRAAPA